MLYGSHIPTANRLATQATCPAQLTEDQGTAKLVAPRKTRPNMLQCANKASRWPSTTLSTKALQGAALNNGSPGVLPNNVGLGQRMF